jgi:hypothetical protein
MWFVRELKSVSQSFHNATYVPNPISSKSDVGYLSDILALLPPMNMSLSIPLHAFAIDRKAYSFCNSLKESY